VVGDDLPRLPVLLLLLPTFWLPLLLALLPFPPPSVDGEMRGAMLRGVLRRTAAGPPPIPTGGVALNAGHALSSSVPDASDAVSEEPVELYSSTSSRLAS
jgi:hypothetical protein